MDATGRTFGPYLGALVAVGSVSESDATEGLTRLSLYCSGLSLSGDWI